MDYAKVAAILISLGHTVTIKDFPEIDFKNNSYRGVFVLYQSAEDPGLQYKSYIEDVLLGLIASGAVLIPDFLKFRAHHNKVFMEILRDLSFSNNPPQTVTSDYFGTYEDYKKHFRGELPAVFKSSEGSKSRAVWFLTKRKTARRIIKYFSSTYSMFNVYRKIKNFFDKKGFEAISNYRKKFIIQNYVSGLTGDYKVLVYNGKYFVLRRENRPRDFRASGSGILSFPENPDTKLLDFAKKVFESFTVPFVSLDIGFDRDQCYLFEFQFVSFGQYAVERAPFYFSLSSQEWVRKKFESTIELEFATATHMFLTQGLYKKSFCCIIEN